MSLNSSVASSNPTGSSGFRASAGGAAEVASAVVRWAAAKAEAVHPGAAEAITVSLGHGIRILLMEANKEYIMKIRIAIIAASAGTLALAQTDLAQATYAGASGSFSTVTSPDLGSSDPATKLAINQWGGKAGTSSSFHRGTSGSFQRLPKSGRTRR
jgi:hypothetical protein